MKTKRYNFVAALVAIMMFAVVFAPIAGCEDSEAATDYWTYTVTSDGKVTGSGSGTVSPTAAGAVGTTGKYTSSDGTSHVGSWGFDSDGYGPFGSFYAAFDACHGNKILCHLNPNDLTQDVDKNPLSTYGTHTLNIMWVLPTVYWSVDSSGNLVLSNDPSKGEAYAHTIDGDVHEYLGIGVYEASTATIGGKTVLTSTTGTTPLYSQQRSVFRDYANNNTVATEDGTTVTGHAMLWNLYAWQLYRFSVLTVGGGWNSQGIFGNGDVYGGHYGTSANATGDLDTSGPYAGNVGNSGSSGSATYHSNSVKAFIEDAWGSLYEFVDGVLIYYDSGQVKMYTTQSSTPTNSSSDYTTMIGVLPSSSNYGSTTTSSSTNPGFWGLPTGTSGAATSGLCDYIYSNTGSSSGSPYGLYVGGYSFGYASSAPKCGLSFMVASDGVGYSGTIIGGRLAFVFDADPAATPTVTYDHSDLTTALNDGGAAEAALPKKITITEGGTYEQLEAQGDNGEWRHIGWEIDGKTYSSTAPFVSQESHTAKSLWSECAIVTLNHDALTDLGGDTFGLDTVLVIESAATEYPDLGEVGDYTHAGWYVDGKFYANGTTVVKETDHTAYSAWKVPTITITYMVEGIENGTLEVPSGSVGVVYTPLNVEGAFVGWYYDAELTNKYDALKKLTTDTTLYAKGVKPLVFTSVPTAEAVITEVDAYGLYYFDATDSDGRYAVQWDFGDGNTSTDPIAYNSYAQPGKYIVTLTVTNANGETATSHYDVNYGVEAEKQGGTPWGAIALVIVIVFVGAVIVRRFL